MGFGGGSAPNRFERLTTLVVAWEQRQQARFDEAQPPPEAARRWARRRGEAGLQRGAGQFGPRASCRSTSTTLQGWPSTKR
eukprot:268388-Pleurochrysis_carterae.AAC.1